MDPHKKKKKNLPKIKCNVEGTNSNKNSTFQHDGFAVGSKGIKSPMPDTYIAENARNHPHGFELNIVKDLGSGQFGSVKLCQIGSCGDYYALKQIPYKNVDDDKEKITDEIGVLLKCKEHKCEYIVKFHDVFFKFNKINIILEYMDSGT